MNGKFVDIHLPIPIDVIKLMMARLTEAEKKEILKVLISSHTLSVKRKETLRGFLKGLNTKENDFQEAEKSLFKNIV